MGRRIEAAMGTEITNKPGKAMKSDLTIKPATFHQLTVLLAVLGLLLALVSGGCVVGEPKIIGRVEVQKGKPPAKNQWRVGVVLGSGGAREQLVNRSIQAALKRAGETLEVDYLTLEPGELASDREAMNYLANNGYNLIIGVGPAQKGILEQAAKEYPDLLFAMIDEDVQGPNIVAVTFREEESAFLAGSLAALMTQTNIVAFVGGADIPVINRQEKAFQAGVDYVNKWEQRATPVQVKSGYAGMFAKAFEDPAKGKAMASADIDGGADVLFHAAGRTGEGVLAAAAERGIKAIGSGYNQNVLYPGTVLTSTVKIMDQGIYQVLQDLSKGQLKPGKRSLGVKQGAVGLVDLKAVTSEENAALQKNLPGLEALRTMKESIPPEVVDKLNFIKSQISNGKVNLGI